MKKFFVLAIAAIFALASCNPAENDGGSKVKKVIITPSELTLSEGTAETLEYSIEPASATYTQIIWSSSDKTVATVNRKGQVTAVSAGVATITCKVDDVEGTCDVTVTSVQTPVTGISVSPEKLNVPVGKNATIIASIEPERASDKTIIWSSTNTSVAVVSDGVVTGVAKGSATITAKTNDGGYTATCEVKVSNPVELKQIALDNGQWAKNNYPVFSPDGKTAYIETLKNDNTLRELLAINLEGAYIDWRFDLTHQDKGWSNNGGDFCVNPVNGDIIVANQTDVFCIQSSGSKRWSITDSDASIDTQSAVMKGSGPAISNDGDVIFAILAKYMYALNATTGEIISSIEANGTHAQFAVYGDNKIILYSSKQISFIEYASNTLTVTKTIEAEMNADVLSDITSPTIYGDKAYFFGKNASSGVIDCVDLTAGTVTTDNYPEHGKSFRWSGTLTPDNRLVFCDANSQLCVLDATKALSAENGSVIYSYKGGYGSAFNFEGPGIDTAGNIYVFLNDPKGWVESGVNAGYFYRFVPTSDGYEQETLAVSVATDPIGSFQGCFGYCGNYLLAVSGNPGRILIAKVDEARANTWGCGGSPQGTKNVNHVGE